MNGSVRRIWDEQEARRILLNVFPYAFFGEWEDRDESIRLPVWADAEAAENDDGSGAIAYIVKYMPDEVA